MTDNLTAVFVAPRAFRGAMTDNRAWSGRVAFAGYGPLPGMLLSEVLRIRG